LLFLQKKYKKGVFMKRKSSVLKKRDKMIQKSFCGEISLREIVIPNKRKYSRKNKSWKRSFTQPSFSA
jgi:hypothetical protein